MSTYMRVPLVLSMIFIMSPLLSAFDLSTDRVQYVVGTSHLDTQWGWDILETINQHIPNTYQKNFALFKKYPAYVFSFEGAYRYMLMKQYYPRAYDSLKTIFVPRGNWRVSGSMVDACDVLIPCPEALIRQILYGNGFFQDEFGKRSVDIFLPDCFGFGYALPTIGTHCGLKGFSTQKLGWLGFGTPISPYWGTFRLLPFDIGVWEGVDSSSLVAAINPGDYNSNWAIKTDAITTNGSRYGVYAGLDYMGCGDAGGAVPDSFVQTLMARIAQNGSQQIKVVNGSSDSLFRDLTSAQVARLPRYNGEFIATTHGTGTYTHHADVKIRNHQAEQQAYAAEGSAAIAEWIAGTTYPRDAFKKAWIRFLWHQFHDDLTGTASTSAYVFTRRDQDSSIAEFTTILDNSKAAMASKMDTRTANTSGLPIVVYNSLSIVRTDVAEASVTFPSGAPANVLVFDKTGAEVAAQIFNRSGNTLRIGFIATVPSMGAALYEVRPSPTPTTISTGLSVDTRVMENSNYRIIINTNGDIDSMIDKRAQNKSMLSAPSRLELRPDTSLSPYHGDTWPQWEIQWKDVNAQPVFVDESPTITIKENGPVRVSIEVHRTKFGSDYIQTYRLCAGEAGTYVLVDNRIDWKSKGYLLKASFPLGVANFKATYDLGIGVIQRPQMDSTLYEVPAQLWADITRTDNTYGVSILTDYKRGWDKAGINLLHLTLIHSPSRQTYGSNDGDLFVHTFKYGIYGHTGDWRTGRSVQAAARFNQPLVAFSTPAHDGTLGKSFSFVKVSDSLSVMAFKKAEKSDEYIVRVREINGANSPNASITFAGPITSAREVNGQEDDKGTVSFSSNKLTFSIKPFQPCAFAVRISSTAISSQSMQSDWPGASPASIKCMSNHIRIQVNSKNYFRINVINALGKSIQSIKEYGTQTKYVNLTLTDVPSGICFVLANVDGKEITQKLIQLK